MKYMQSLVRIIYGLSWFLSGLALIGGGVVAINAVFTSSFQATVNQWLYPLIPNLGILLDVVPFFLAALGLALVIIGSGLLRSIIRRSVVADFAGFTLHIALVCCVIILYLTMRQRVQSINLQESASLQFGEGAAVLQDIVGLLNDLPVNLEQLPDYVQDTTGLTLTNLFPSLTVPPWVPIAAGIFILLYVLLPFLLLLPSSDLVKPNESRQHKHPNWKHVCPTCGGFMERDKTNGGYFCPRHNRARFVEGRLIFKPSADDGAPLPEDALNLLKEPIILRFNPAQYEVTIGTGEKDDGRIPAWLHPDLGKVEEHHAEIHYNPNEERLTLHNRVGTALQNLQLNGKTVIGGTVEYLDDGANIKMGDAEFEFHFEVIPEN